MIGLLLSTLAAGSLLFPRDTVIDVRQGDRLLLSDFSGTVFVETWNRPEMSLDAESDEAVRFRVTRAGNRLDVRVEDRKRRNRAEEIRIVMPPWVDLELSGRDLEAHVWDVGGAVSIRNLRGDISLRNLTAEVDVHTIEGSIEASGLSGVARLRTGDDDLWVGSSTADLELETVEGEIHLEGLAARRISLTTTDGDVEFAGRLLENGEYRFVAHGGDMEFLLAAPVNLDVTVLVYEGEFDSEFPVRTKGYRTGEELRFTVGNGGGRLVVEAFDGDVELLRMRSR
ncbi:DUF4097 domain-containing protein [Gemmatimonadota bacterium]